MPGPTFVTSYLCQLPFPVSFPVFHFQSQVWTNTKVYIATANTQTSCQGRTIPPIPTWIQWTKSRLNLLRAPLTCTDLQGKGLVHKTDVHTACLGVVLALPEGNLVFSTSRIWPRTGTQSPPALLLYPHFVNLISATGYIQICTYSAYRMHLESISLVSTSLRGRGSFPMT